MLTVVQCKEVCNLLYIIYRKVESTVQYFTIYIIVHCTLFSLYTNWKFKLCNFQKCARVGCGGVWIGPLGKFSSLLHNIIIWINLLKLLNICAIFATLCAPKNHLEQRQMVPNSYPVKYVTDLNIKVARALTIEESKHSNSPIT